MKKIVISLVLLSLVFSGCKDEEEPIGLDVQYQVVELSTDFGSMYLWLYEETAIHKHNFDSLTESGFYDGTEFHRLVPNFVIQGGDPNSKDSIRSNDGSGGPGYTLTAEIDSTRFKHNFGAIGAARLGNQTNPERRSSGSQFYIVTDTTGAHFLDGEYTVFGEVLKGMDVALTIQSQPRTTPNNRPITRIPMQMELLSKTRSEFESMGIILPL